MSIILLASLYTPIAACSHSLAQSKPLTPGLVRSKHRFSFLQSAPWFASGKFEAALAGQPYRRAEITHDYTLLGGETPED